MSKYARRRSAQRGWPSYFIGQALPCWLALGAAFAAGVAGAQPEGGVRPETYRARLSPMPRTLQTVAAIKGSGEVMLELAGTTLSVRGTFQGMSSPPTVAHIHRGSPGLPGPVALHIEVTPRGDGGMLAGEVELSEEQLANLRNQSMYVQVHSANNPAGELRGWIFPARSTGTGQEQAAIGGEPRR